MNILDQAGECGSVLENGCATLRPLNPPSPAPPPAAPSDPRNPRHSFLYEQAALSVTEGAALLLAVGSMVRGRKYKIIS